MTINGIFKQMGAAEKNRAECYNKAFAARTYTEQTTHALEAERWSTEWLRLSRKVGKLVDKG